MSESGRDGPEIRVSRDGVSVLKTLEREAFPVPAVGFELRAERNTPSTVHLTDPIPASVPANDIGFHAEYDEGCWAIEDDTAVFERDMMPGEELTTFYAIREADADDVESELVEPELTVVPLPPSNDDGSRAVETTAVPDSARSASVGVDPPVDEPVGSDGLSISGSVASALAAELRRGSVAEADRAQLREALEFGGDVERIESLLADTLAQTEALETALGEGGDIPRLLESVSEGMITLQHDVEGLGERIDALDERLETLEDDVDELTSWRARMGALFSGEATASSDETAGRTDDDE